MNIKKKVIKLKFLRVKGGVRWGGGVSGWWGGRVGGGIRMDVKAMLGVGGDVGYGGCEPE